MIGARTSSQTRMANTLTKPLSISITNSNLNPVYHPGSYVEGVVTINAPHADDVTIADMEISLTGVKKDPRDPCNDFTFLLQKEPTLTERVRQHGPFKQGSTTSVPFIFTIPADLPETLKSILDESESPDSDNLVYSVHATLIPVKGGKENKDNGTWKIMVSSGSHISTLSAACSQEITVRPTIKSPTPVNFEL